MIDVVTVRYGQKYGPEYLQRWAAGVKRNISVPYRLTCFTDDDRLHDPDVASLIRPDLGGWWNQLWVFSGWTLNRQIVMDVDSVIVGSLDELASYDGPHVANHDAYQPWSMDAGFHLLPAGARRNLFDEFLGNQAALKTVYRSPKEFLIDRIQASTQRMNQVFPGQWVSYKVDCAPRGGLPPNARIVGFHGRPHTHEVSDPWILEHWGQEAPTYG